MDKLHNLPLGLVTPGHILELDHAVFVDRRGLGLAHGEQIAPAASAATPTPGALLPHPDTGLGSHEVVQQRKGDN